MLQESHQADSEMFTISNALVQSVKLGIWEASLEDYVESIEHVTNVSFHYLIIIRLS